MSLPPFEYCEPRSVAEACALLAEDPEGSRIFAGGSDLLVSLKEGLVRFRRLVSLRRIAELGRVECSPERGLEIGATATVNQVARHTGVARYYPGLADAARAMGAEQVRNSATVGGNLCNAVPSADMAPILLALGARLRLQSTSDERVVPAAEFFAGPRQTVLRRGEVLVAVEVGPPGLGTGSASLRQGGRESLSLPLAAAATWVRIAAGACEEATVALGAVAPTPIVAASAGRFLAGRTLTAEVLREAGELASAEARPIDDLRASREYRLELVRVLTRRSLESAARRAAEGR
jgi:aerobic carbon-monoxide dehydrogenase medium subunit